MAAQQRIILGIDPGTNILGYGVILVDKKSVHYVDMGVIDLRKEKDHFLKLSRIFEGVGALMERYAPDDLAIEAPFYGKNVQSMLKLGRAQGVAIAAAIQRDIPIHEYAPLKIKMAITGNGSASKEQVAGMLRRLLQIPEDHMPHFLDATDALGAAYCHFMQMGRPESQANFKGWKDFVNKNQQRICRPPLK